MNSSCPKRRLLSQWLRLVRADDEDRDEAAIEVAKDRIEDAMLGVMPDESDDRMLAMTSTSSLLKVLVGLDEPEGSPHWSELLRRMGARNWASRKPAA